MRTQQNQNMVHNIVIKAVWKLGNAQSNRIWKQSLQIARISYVFNAAQNVPTLENDCFSLKVQKTKLEKTLVKNRWTHCHLRNVMHEICGGEKPKKIITHGQIVCSWAQQRKIKQIMETSLFKLPHSATFPTRRRMHEWCKMQSMQRNDNKSHIVVLRK